MVVGPGFVSTSPAFMRRSANHPAGPHDRLAPQKNGKWGTHCWGWELSTQFAQPFVTVVTAPPLVGFVVWCQINSFHMFESSSHIIFESLSHVVIESLSHVVFESSSHVVYESSSHVIFESSSHIVFESSSHVVLESSSPFIF